MATGEQGVNGLSAAEFVAADDVGGVEVGEDEDFHAAACPACRLAVMRAS